MKSQPIVWQLFVLFSLLEKVASTVECSGFIQETYDTNTQPYVLNVQGQIQAFAGCVPSVDPNSAEDVVRRFARATGFVLFGAVTQQLRYSGNTCNFFGTNSCELWADGVAPNSQDIVSTFGHYRFFDVQFRKVRCAITCKGGFKVPDGSTCSRDGNRPCSEACDPNTITIGLECYYCVANTEPNPDQTACVDLNECQSGHSCPVNSECENLDFVVTGQTYQCRCNVGFVIQGLDIRLGGPLSTCIPSQITLSVSDIRPNSVFITLFAPAVDDFLLEVFVVSETNGEFKIGELVAQGDVLYDGLYPGLHYKVVGTVLDGSLQPTSFSSGEMFTTACTCEDAPANATNGNGKPSDLVVSQDEGFVTFTFVDQSRCEEAYSLIRKSALGSSNVVFAPNYYYSSENVCGEVYKPGRIVTDDLAKAGLSPGDTYTYCVRAIGALVKSEGTCADHTVRWESAVTIAVALPTAARGIPVTEATINYVLQDADGVDLLDLQGNPLYGSAVTDKDGEAVVKFSFIPIENSLYFNLHYVISKFTPIGVNDTINHKFLCNGGLVECNPEGNTRAIRNFEFGRVISVIDDTSVGVTGRVVIGTTGCVLPGVQVCVNVVTAVSRDSSQLCIDTDGLGEFELSAVIGTTIVVSASYNNHSMVLTSAIAVQNGDNGQGPGFRVLGDTQYNDLLFTDTQMTDLTVDIVGGLCNRYLGNTLMTYTIRGCQVFAPPAVTQVGTRAVYSVYSQPIDVYATAYGIQELEIQFIDLRELENSTTTTSQELTEDISNYLRFQYDGDTTLTFQANKAVPRCTNVMSFNSYRPTTIRIFVEETFPNRLEDDSVVAPCDRFAPESRLLITNKLGLDPLDTQDADFLRKLRAEGVPETVIRAYTLCNDPSDNPSKCISPLSYDDTGGNGHIVATLLIGPPNLFGDHTKVLRAEFQRVSSVTAATGILSAVIVGDYDEGVVEVVNLPVYEPLMILRDPPGGDSYVEYKNILSTIEITHEKYKKVIGDADRLHFALEHHEIGTCTGGGVIVTAELCTEFGVGIKFDFTSDKYDAYVDRDSFKTNEYTSTFTTTWSYKTSMNPWTAGQASDVFVVPSLNIALRRVQEISLTDPGCTAQKIEFIKVSGTEDFAVSFLTYDDVLNLGYNDTIAGLQNALDAEPNQARKDKLQEAIDDTNAAIQAWEKVIIDYLATNAAAANRVNVLLPHEWFFNLSKTETLADVTHWSGLVPKSLADEAVPIGTRDNVNLEEIDVVTFTGGGSAFLFSLQYDQQTSVTSLNGNNSEVKDEYIRDIGLGYTVAIIKGYVTGGRRDVTHIEQANTITRLAKDSSMVTFQLGDDNLGDRFDVQIALDPKYGTFIFTTKSTSASKCPREAGTAAREGARLEVITSPSAPVLPDELMVFKLRLTNTGDDISVFQLAIDPKSNPDGLTFNFPAPVIPIEALGSGASIEYVVEVRRGPSKFIYPGLSIAFRSACEYDEYTLNNDNFWSSPLTSRTLAIEQLYNDAGTGQIVFAQPCTQIGLALPQAGETVVVNGETGTNVDVVVRNHAISRSGSFTTQIANNTLTAVQLKYASTTQRRNIFTGLKAAVEEIDFAAPGVEDVLGFSRIQWNIEINGVPDGEYEFWAESQCDGFLGAPPGFNSYESQRVHLIVDRKSPRLFKQIPPAGSVSIGEAVEFHFTEEISCKDVAILANVEGMTSAFDNQIRDNLLVTCEENVVAFQFDPVLVDYTELIGKSFNASLSNVRDLNGNYLGKTIVVDLSIADIDLSTVGVEFDVILQRNCSFTQQEMQNEIAAAVNIEPSLIRINNLRCIGTDTIIISVEILSADPNEGVEGNATLRILSAKLTPLDIFYRLNGQPEDVSRSRYLQEGLSMLNALPGFVSMSGLQLNIPPGTTTQNVYLETDRAALESLASKVQSLESANAVDNQEALSAKLASLEQSQTLLLIGLVTAVAVSVIGSIIVVRKMNAVTTDRPPSQSSEVPHFGSLESINPTFKGKI